MVLACTAGCGGGDDSGTHDESGGGNDGAHALASNLSVDPSTVQGFVLAPTVLPSARARIGSDDPESTGGAVAVGEPVNVLYALGADGTLTAVTTTEVTVTNDDGTVETRPDTVSADYQPDAIIDTKSFTFLPFHVLNLIQKDGTWCSMVAARKSDGALFCVPSQPSFGALDLRYYPQIASDSSGNFLVEQFANGQAPGRDVPLDGSGLMTLDFAGGVTPTQTMLLNQITDNVMVEAFGVNSNGDALAVLDTGARVYKRAGGFTNVGNGVECVQPGVGVNSAAFFYKKNPTQTASGGLFKLEDVGGSWMSTLYADYEQYPELWLTTCNAGDVARGDTAIYAKGDAAFFLEYGNPSSATVVVHHDVPGVDHLDALYAFTGGLVIAAADVNNNSALVRWDGTTYTTLLASGEYTVTKISVGSSGDVTFAGRRNADNERILGNIAADSTDVSIVTQDFAGDVVQIQRIN